MIRHRFLSPLAVLIATFTWAALDSPGVAQAGGSFGGSSGGYYSGYGSSGGGYASAGSRGGTLLGHLRPRMDAYGSSGGSTGGAYAAASYGSSGGHVGPLRRLVARLHAHRASRGSSGGYAANHGGSSGGSTGYVSSSYGSSGGASSGGGMGYSSPVSYSAPVQSMSYGATSSYESPTIESSYETYAPVESHAPVEGTIIHDSGIETGAPSGGAPTPTPDPNSSAPAGDSASYESAKPALESDAAMLTVTVPSEDAKVTVNGHKTSSDGAIRQFVSHGLKAGYVYTYVVKVEYEEGGEAKSKEKSVKLRSGDTERVIFETESQPSDAKVTVTKNDDTTTIVKLLVPADAKVVLAGNETNGSGSIRTFRTTQLQPGQQWSDYTVRVTASVNGQTISKERTVDVIAGSTTELAFDFDSTVVAQR